ncbi:hypothetical protein CLD22_26215 [Rubrivivax gelatinosus]|uniref:hypothetical protein n=1 Tax=Rubrivivax gelatinosus TaxID=28068 RepID=UPI001903AB1C|nr:hypothetical protein [Rubrivivax gelatinosus]MBZ8143341.1 hypothetical protein [Rubrivivax gelatinosus]
MDPKQERRTIDGAGVLVSNTGTLTLTVRRWRSRLYLERRERLPTGAMTAVSMVFHCPQEFAAWCGADPTRFDEPLLAAQLRRLGDAAFSDNG